MGSDQPKKSTKIGTHASSETIHPAKRYSRYTWLVGGAAVAMIGFLIAYGAQLDPLDGDLTRIGGYVEKEYGWNTAQTGFASPGFLLGDELGDYAPNHTVVVFGDSFSLSRPDTNWLSYLHDATGFEIVLFSLSGKVTLEAFLQSEEFRTHPPALLIYETVERSWMQRFLAMSGEVEPSAGSPEALSTKLRPVVAVRKEIHRPETADLKTRISTSINHIERSIARAMKLTEVEALEIDRPSPMFSSKKAESLLVLKDDLGKRAVSDETVAQALSHLDVMRSRVEANGVTRFLAVVFPDKLTVYTEWLHEKDSLPKSLLPALRGSDTVLPLDEVLMRLVSDGAQDVYLPNDSHAGWIGSEAAAKTVVEFVTSDAFAH